VFAPLPPAELAKWDEDQKAKAEKRGKLTAKRKRARRSKLEARRRWFQLDLELQEREPVQLGLFRIAA
jgi:hypothetical protein